MSDNPRGTPGRFDRPPQPPMPSAFTPLGPPGGGRVWKGAIAPERSPNLDVPPPLPGLGPPPLVPAEASRGLVGAHSLVPDQARRGQHAPGRGGLLRGLGLLRFGTPTAGDGYRGCVQAEPAAPARPEPEPAPPPAARPPDESPPWSGSGSKPDRDRRPGPDEQKRKEAPKEADTSSPKPGHPLLTYKPLPEVAGKTTLEEFVLLTLGAGGPWTLELVGLEDAEFEGARLRVEPKTSGEAAEKRSGSFSSPRVCSRNPPRSQPSRSIVDASSSRGIRTLSGGAQVTGGGSACGDCLLEVREAGKVRWTVLLRKVQQKRPLDLGASRDVELDWGATRPRCEASASGTADLSRNRIRRQHAPPSRQDPYGRPKGMATDSLSAAREICPLSSVWSSSRAAIATSSCGPNSHPALSRQRRTRYPEKRVQQVAESTDIADAIYGSRPVGQVPDPAARGHARIRDQHARSADDPYPQPSGKLRAADPDRVQNWRPGLRSL